jgi:hypothetical protein
VVTSSFIIVLLVVASPNALNPRPIIAEDQAADSTTSIATSSTTETTSAASTGLYAAYWLGTFFGSPAPAWPNCPTNASTPVPPSPAGSATITPPTVTETDPNINFGSTTGFYWVESYPSTPTTPPSPGYPGGFAVTQGGYGTALSSWADKTLYADYPTSTYFVDTDYSVVWTGYIYLTAGTYYFQLDSDDGSALYINPATGSSSIPGADLVINNYAEQPPTNATGTLTVSATGNYAIEVDYYQTCDTQSGIDLSWSTTSPTSGFTIISTTAFTPAQLGSNRPVFGAVTTTKTVAEFPSQTLVPTLLASMILAISLLALTRRRARGKEALHQGAEVTA